MRKVKAKLIKLTTDDGLMSMKDNVELGKIYTIDTDSLRNIQSFNFEKKVNHEKMMVMDIERNALLPIELLEIME